MVVVECFFLSIMNAPFFQFIGLLRPVRRVVCTRMTEVIFFSSHVGPGQQKAGSSSGRWNLSPSGGWRGRSQSSAPFDAAFSLAPSLEDSFREKVYASPALKFKVY